MLAQFVLFDGFDPLDVIAPYEVLYAGGLDVALMSAEGARSVPGGIGFSLTATGPLTSADIVVVPGAAAKDLDEVPALLGRAAGTLGPVLKEALDRPGTTVATVCGGSMLLAMAGLINGRPATTNHIGLELFGTLGPVVIDARVVDDGDLVTGAGMTSGLDVGLYLLERELGAQTALYVEKLIAHERRGTVWKAAA